jgi:hypothetical protein
MQLINAHKVFVDERSTKILLAALYRPLSGLEIGRISGIPVAKVFSRLKLLEKRGLIGKVASTYTADGREIPLYQSILYDAYMFLEQGRLKARFKLVSCSQKDYTVDAEALL